MSSPRLWNLVVTEAIRLIARPAVRTLIALALLGYVAGVIALWVTHAKVTAADRAQAVRARDAQIAVFRSEVAQCAASVPPGDVASQCGPVPSADDIPLSQYYRHHPLAPRQVTDTAQAVGVGFAALGFLIGATSIGAEWASKNIANTLIWETRRIRLVVAKLVALLAVLTVLSGLVQLSWAAAGRIVLHARGTPVPGRAATFWHDLATTQVHAVVLTTVMAAVGFGLALLARSTTVALGVSFLYFALVEGAVRAINQNAQPYFLTTNVSAWLSPPHGRTVFGSQHFDRHVDGYVARVLHVSDARGGVVLAVIAAVLVGAAATAFVRRDVA